MEVKVYKNKQEYIFELEDNTCFVGKYHYRRFKEIKSLYYKNELITEIKLRISFLFKISFVINLKSEEIFLKFNGFGNPKYTCYFKDDFYEIISHRGTKCSIFKNNIQIAYYEEKQIEFMGRHAVNLVADDNINLSLILCFILALKCDFENDYSTVTFDFGYIGTEKIKFNSLWKPNDFHK